jgi:hypothetical protein
MTSAVRYFESQIARKNFRRKETAMPESRNKTIETINSRQIPKIELAAAVELDSSRISDYIKHRPLAPERIQKIEAAVQKIAYVWDTFKPFRIVLDSPKLLEQAYSEAQSEREVRSRDGMTFEAVPL